MNKSIAFEIEREINTAEQNRVLCKGRNLEISVSVLLPREETLNLRYPNLDKFLRIEEGEGIISFDCDEFYVEQGTGVFIPQNQQFCVRNIGAHPLKFWAINGYGSIGVVA